MNEMFKLGYQTNRDIIYPSFKTTSRLQYFDNDEELALLRQLNPQADRNGLKPLEIRDQETTRNLKDTGDSGHKYLIAPTKSRIVFQS